MPSPWDANIKLLDAVDLGTNNTIDDVPNGASFDVLALVEIGENLNEHVDKFDLRVGIRNLTQSVTVATVNASGNLTPANNSAFLNTERVNIPAAWGPAAPGDVLQAVAAYRVKAGVNDDISAAQSLTFIVS